MTDGDTKGAEWSIYWSGRAQLEGGRAFVGAGVERDKDLTEFWEQNLIECPVESRCLDLACGAGVVVRHAVSIGFYEVYGLDISPKAIALMKEANPSVTGLVGSAHKMPLRDACIDVITSQFGFEYAGVEQTMPEIARILAPGGRLLTVVHMSEGEIARECGKARKEASEFAHTGFIEAAKDVFIQAFALSDTPNDRSAYDAAVNRMRPAQAKLSTLSGQGNKMAQHALAGTGKLFQRRQNYALQDIIDWLDQLSRENQAHYDRMDGMLKAAISRMEGERALKILEAQGLITSPLVPLRVGPEKDKIAWILNARKPAV